MRRIGNHDGMAELYRRGCFRHIEDVAYARIMLERQAETIDEIASYLDSLYMKITQRCDRVYPPS